MFLLNGNPLPLDIPFVHDGVQYPANWLRLTTWEEKAAIGITEVGDPVSVDDRFYYVSMQGDPVAKDLTMLKENFKKQVDQTTYMMLQPTDWYIIRKQETDTEIPAKIATHRNTIRTTNENNKIAIDGATTIDELKVVVDQIPSSWPILDLVVT